jgi:hypothetical protein
MEKIEALRKEKEIKRIVNILKNLYYTGEMLQLKGEATRYIKDGYISEKINYYLKKAIENETAYKIGLKEQKIQARYNVLRELYKK